jgi:hypothetical protein
MEHSRHGCRVEVELNHLMSFAAGMNRWPARARHRIGAYQRAPARAFGLARRFVSWPMLRRRKSRLRRRPVGMLRANGAHPAARLRRRLRDRHGMGLAFGAVPARDGEAASRPGKRRCSCSPSRHTLFRNDTRGEPFRFTEFSREPQCFLTETQLDAELARAGFARDPRVFTSKPGLP